MKPEEAIDYLQDPIGKREKHDEAIQMAIEALEKQIPKKPADGKSCPNCGKDMWMEEYKFCQDCGQAIDWRIDG